MPDALPVRIRHQRARGQAQLGLRAGPGGARIAHLFHAAPLRLLFPDVDEGDPTLGAFCNVAGGLAGGDALDLSLRLAQGARFTATTPAAEKVYRSLGEATEIAAAVSLGSGAVCEWLPQETILFDGARLSRRLEIDLPPDARLLAAEMLVLGRGARGERFAQGALHDRWRVRRAGRLAWADALRIEAPAAARGRFLLDGAGALATLLLATPDAAAHLPRARGLAAGGATLVAPGLLLLRWAGEAGAVRGGVAAAVAALRAEALGHPPRLPRLWRT